MAVIQRESGHRDGQLAELHFIEDMACEVRCGNEVGYGIVELVLIGKYPKYGYQGY